MTITRWKTCGRWVGAGWVGGPAASSTPVDVAIVVVVAELLTKERLMPAAAAAAHAASGAID
jgi:hypothetical protein